MSKHKEVGSLEKKVLYYLAENCDHFHKQKIQKGIGYPSEQYGSVLKAVNSLERKQFIKSEMGESEKGRVIKLYSCTEKGVSYTIAHNPEADIPLILDNYEKEYSIFGHFRYQYEIWGHDLFIKFYNYIGQYQALGKEYGFEKSTALMLTAIYPDVKTFTKAERQKIFDVIRDHSAYNQFFQKFKKIIDEILE